MLNVDSSFVDWRSNSATCNVNPFCNVERHLKHWQCKSILQHQNITSYTNPLTCSRFDDFTCYLYRKRSSLSVTFRLLNCCRGNLDAMAVRACANLSLAPSLWQLQTFRTIMKDFKVSQSMMTKIINLTCTNVTYLGYTQWKLIKHWNASNIYMR